MMDGSMYPEGWHFVQSTKTPDDMMKYAKYHSRTERPPKYYLTDFGISRRYNPKDGPPREHPILGGDKTVPEFQKPTGLLDPFPTDIYYVGNFLRESILQVKILLPSIQALILNFLTIIRSTEVSGL